MTKDELIKVFDKAKELECSICVEVTIPDQEDSELIINAYKSLDSKLKYYLNSYDDNLVHKGNNNIKIVNATPIDFEIASEEYDQEK